MSNPILSIIIPVYNEIGTVTKLLDWVCSVPIDKQIIVVDDGSRDGTREALKTAAERFGEDIQLIFHEVNCGKGASLRSAIPHIRGQYCIFQDADLELDPFDYLVILQEFKTTDSDVVYGSRFLNGFPHMTLSCRIANMILNYIVRILYRVKLTDEATCYKAFRSDVIVGLPLYCCRFDMDAEITAKLILRGYKITEVPVRYKPRSFKQGKKIRWQDGVISAWTLIRLRLAPVLR